MNFFEFLTNIIEFSFLGFGHFIVAFTMISLVGIMVIAMLGTLAKFRLFTYNKKKESEGPTLKLTSNNDSGTPNESNIYDLLVDAYDRYKTKKNNKGSGEGE